MKITSIKVTNFKSLKNVHISGFKSLNLIYGLNNSGKSNLLELLELVFRSKTIESQVDYDDQGKKRVRRSVDENTPFWRGQIYDRPFIFTKNNTRDPITFQIGIEFNNDNFPELIQQSDEEYLRGNGTTILTVIGRIVALNSKDSEIILNRVEAHGKVIFQNDDGKVGNEKYFPQADPNKNLKDNEELGLEILDMMNDLVFLIESNRHFAQEDHIDGVPSLSPSTFKNWLYNLYINSETYQEFIDFQKFLSDFQISGRIMTALKENVNSFPLTSGKIEFTKFGDEIEVMLNTAAGRFPLKNFGTGIQQIIYILAKIFSTSSKILIIEELELNLSNEYQELLIENVKSFENSGRISQLFFTSHSRNLFRNDYNAFEVTIDAKGESSIQNKPFTEQEAQMRQMKKEMRKPKD